MRDFTNSCLSLLAYSKLRSSILLYSYTEERAINNLVNDFSECAAYLILSSAGAKNCRSFPHVYD